MRVTLKKMNTSEKNKIKQYEMYARKEQRIGITEDVANFNSQT